MRFASQRLPEVCFPDTDDELRWPRTSSTAFCKSGDDDKTLGFKTWTP